MNCQNGFVSEKIGANRALARWMVAGLGVFLVLAVVLAPGARANDPNNGIITAIDARSGLVTARETATGRTFQFKVSSILLLRTLKVGQAVEADFGAKSVSITGVHTRFRILDVTPAGAGSRPGVTASPAETSKPKTDQPKTDQKTTTKTTTTSTKPTTGAASTDLRASEGDTAGAIRGRPAHAGTSRAVANVVRLRQHPQAQEIMQGVIKDLMGKEIDVALLGGKEYMVGKCLGVRAGAGKFKLRLASPNLRFENTGVVLTFRIPRIAMSALRVRVRPNPTNLANTCTFGHAFDIGGSASDLRYEVRFDPILDVQQCRVGTMGRVHHLWRIGGLNLKPLQNNLDEMAKNMIEDSLTYTSNFSVSDRIVGGINGLLGVHCHK